MGSRAGEVCVPRFAPFVVLVLLALPAKAVEPIKDAGRSPAVCTTGGTELPVSKARLFAFGNYRGPPASQIAEAQRFFDQGLVFGWGFNFAESVRSFRAAAQLDLDCALCRWGIAWALGPSINHDMVPADMPVALDALVQARTIAAAGSRERDLIDALTQRYSDRPGVDAGRLAQSYANAMRALADRYPADADVTVLAAEAMMNAHAYDYWRGRGGPQPWTPQIISWLDRALHLAPAHPGAHHYRIHLYEDSQHPERALASAEQLGGLAPIVGHLVHMPSHIYFRIGRYRDAVQANAAAVQADRDYATAAGVESDYAIHNLHFLWASALWSGDGDTASRAAGQLAAAAAAVAGDIERDATRQHLAAAPVLTHVRLRLWEAIARTHAREVNGSGAYLRGLEQFASGIAHATRGDVAAASAELESLQRSAGTAKSASLTVKNIHRASDVLAVARALLQSAIATARGANADAVRYARAAVVAEDRLESDDPPVWLIPARHALGASLLRSGRAAEARDVYRADLQRHPNNCVALAGIAAAQGKLQPLPASLQPSAQVPALFSHCPE